MTRHWTDAFAATDDSSDAHKSVVDAFFKVDWAATPVGALDTWDYSTRSIVCQVFKTESTLACLLLGEEFHIIYNAAALEFYRDRHPFMMGKPYRIAWADIDVFEAIMDQMRDVKNSGLAKQIPTSPVNFFRNEGQVKEQMFCSYEILPIMDDQQNFTLVLIRLDNHTRAIREQDRSRFLARLHEKLLNVQDFETLYRECISVLSKSDAQIPWLRIYSLDYLSGSFSLVARHDCSEEYIAAVADNEVQIEELLRGSITSHKPVWHALTIENAHLDFLIYPPVQDPGLAFSRHVLLLGRNPRHEVDDTSRHFVRSCASTIASALGVIASTAMLKRSERRFQEMLLKAPIGFNVEDEKTRLPTFINSAWREMCDFHLELGQINPGADFASLLHDSNREQIMKEYAAVSKDRPLRNREVRLKRRYYPRNSAAGTQEDSVWLNMSSTWVPSSYSQSASILFSVVDISESKYLERVSLKKLDEAVELQRLQSESTFERERADAAERSAAKHLQYIDFSSHELRNPLGAIMQAVDLSRIIVEETHAPSADLHEVLDHLQSIMICAKHMSRIVDDTLSFSQLDHGALQIALMPCKLDLVAHSVLAMFRAELTVKRIELICDIAETGYVLTDGSRFSQILINLITNALKFAPQDGTGRVSVGLSMKRQPTDENTNQVQIDCYVKDNGVGMPEHVVASLFQKFSQASAKTHIQYGGSGLGLYISKRLTELLGGKIQAASSPGHGAILSFYIVATQAEDVPVKLPLLEPRHPNSTNDKIPHLVNTTHPQDLRSSTSAAKEAERKTLLIVEDNLVNQRLMSKLLSGTYNILTANNGLECLELMQSVVGRTIDLVLCDIEMPVMNGYEAVRQVKQWQTLQDMPLNPFLAVSANARPEQVQKMLDAGMDQTISKPFGREEILKVVDQMLATRL